MNFLSKIKFLLKRPKVIIVAGNGRQTAREAIFQVLRQHFSVGKDVLIFETDLNDGKKNDTNKFKFLIKNSSLPILVITRIGDIPADKDFFAGEKEKVEEIEKLVKMMPGHSWLILNFDDETVREMADITNLKTLTFGFQERADFWASDINLNGWDASSASVAAEPVRGTNFKINYKGNIVPIWLERLFGKEQIYSALAVACVATIFGLNLIEISQALKNYKSLPGEQK